MSDMGRWIFASNGNGCDEGLNDAGIETFSTNRVQSTIREAIQNAVDQRSDIAKANNLPVIVEFDDFLIQPDDFPGAKQFKDILDKCICSSKDNKLVSSFFSQAKQCLGQEIKVLRISDYNTTGLDGAESGNKGTSWYNLVKAKGSSNKSMTSGGSFGIGKSAPFACSELRTVIYGSKVDDVDSYVGVSRLISHEEKDKVGNSYTTQGTGFYSGGEKLNAILRPFRLGTYERTTNGTDIFILGFDGEGDFRTEVIETVAYNFFIAIYNGELIVKYKKTSINKNTIGQIIAHLDEKKYGELKVYYKLLSIMPTSDNKEEKRIILDSKEYGSEFGFNDGECTLLLLKGDELNRKILMSRKTGMTLFLQKGFMSNINFTGLLLITGDKMNQMFKEMEVPAHDAWEPAKCKIERNKHVRAYEELRKYLRNKVVECFGDSEETSVVAYGMEEFFHSTTDGDSGVEVSITKNSPKVTIERSKRRKPITKKDKPREDDIDELGLEEATGYVPGDDPNVVVGDGDDAYGVGGSGKGHGGDAENPKHEGMNDPNKEDGKIPVKEIKYKAKQIKKRLICIDEEKGYYSLRFRPDRKKKDIKLEFLGMGEKDSAPMYVSEVSVEGGSECGEVTSQEDWIKIHDVPGKKDITIKFRIKFSGKCMMEVGYYEA